MQRALVPLKGSPHRARAPMPGSNAGGGGGSSRPASSPSDGHAGGVDSEYDAFSMSPQQRRATSASTEDRERRTRTRALQALTDAVKKQTADLGVGSSFTRVPAELLLQEVLLLQPWAVLVDDSTVLQLAAHNEKVRAREALLKQMASTRGALQSFIAGAGQTEGALVAGVVPFRGTRHLDLTGASEITDHSLAALAHVCPTLDFLSLAGCVRLSDAGIHALCVANPGLLSLNLNGTSGHLDGTAAEAIGTVCTKLRELHLRRCSWLRPWMIVRLFSAMPDLEVVDLSHVASLSDGDVTVVAKRCPRLRHVDFRECCNTSDAAVMALTMHCPGLVFAALSRTDQKYKITDVSLLSLAERCPGLRHLDVSGLDKITDTGLSWLASGCAALEFLDLSGCYRVTDTGMRVLCAACPALRELRLAGDKAVTDTGVTEIGKGCPQMERLDLGGLVFVTNGAKRDFAPRGLVALADCCHALRSVKLGGVFQLGAQALRALAANAPGLQELVVPRCPNVGHKAVRAVAEHCRDLRVLDVSRCPKVNNKCLRTLARGCPHLEKLNVEGCDEVGISDAGVKALVRGCRRLVHLNIPGYKRISDLALLAVVEANMKPGLEFLNLAGARGVTETGLAWLAEKCPTLLSLNVRGCAVPFAALKGLRQSWTHVSICRDDQFFGYAPDHRAREKRRIDHFAVAWKAAVKLQSLYRRSQALVAVAKAQEDRIKRWAALKWQSLWRRRQAKRAFLVVKWQRKKEEDAAKAVQKIARRIKAKRILRQKKHAAWIARRAEAAVTLQCAWRNFRAKCLYGLILAAKRAWDAKASKLATRIQQRWRGLVGRRQFKLILTFKAILAKKQEDASVNVQRLLRMRLARKEADRRRREAAKEEVARHDAAVRIQALYRMRSGLKARIRRVVLGLNRVKAATMMQGVLRGRKERLRLRKWFAALEVTRQTKAATVVQAAARMLSSKLLLRAKQNASLEHARKLERVARMGQRWLRGKWGRRRAQDQQMQLLLHLAKQDALDKWAAVTIQALCRGRLGRKRAKQRRKEVANFWKTIWDATEERNVYFNMHTSEMRVRKPQALLNLMAPPVCENCEYYHATTECRQCKEYFCDECWSSIHFGGKRKKHNFRALYDFYNKRIDYGDGEFPCKWPSEVEQDEFFGWFLRDPNGKEPVEVGGWPWAKYLDDDQVRHYYFNQKTAELVYERPPGMDTQVTAKDAARAQLRNAVELEQGWKKYFDDETGRTFYFNPDTGENSYKRPDGFSTPRDQAVAIDNTAVVDERRRVQNRYKDVINQAENWTRYFDEESGREFYFNAFSNESTFDRPEAYVDPGEGGALTTVPAGPVETGDAHWAKYWDEAAQAEFYFNSVTNESTYDRPVNFFTPRDPEGDKKAAAYYGDGDGYDYGGGGGGGGAEDKSAAYYGAYGEYGDYGDHEDYGGGGGGAGKEHEKGEW